MRSLTEGVEVCSRESETNDCRQQVGEGERNGEGSRAEDENQETSGPKLRMARVELEPYRSRSIVVSRALSLCLLKRVECG